MVKQKGGYTSQMKARVKYPKLRPKSEKKQELRIMSATQVEDQVETPIAEDELEVKESPTVEECPSIVTNGHVADEATNDSNDEDVDIENPLEELKAKKKLINRGSGTFRMKNPSMKSLHVTSRPSREDIITFIEQDEVFNSQLHRTELMNLVFNYSRDVRKRQILDMLDDELFEDENVMKEVENMIKEFLRVKSNNNI